MGGGKRPTQKEGGKGGKGGGLGYLAACFFFLVRFLSHPFIIPLFLVRFLPVYHSRPFFFGFFSPFYHSPLSPPPLFFLACASLSTPPLPQEKGKKGKKGPQGPPLHAGTSLKLQASSLKPQGGRGKGGGKEKKWILEKGSGGMFSLRGWLLVAGGGGGCW